MKKLKALLFDIDGTLISLEPAIKSIQDTCRELGYRVLTEEEIKKNIISKPLAQQIKKIFNITEEKAEEFYQKQHENMNKNYPPILIKNSKETISYFKKQGYKIGLVTTKRKKSALTALEKTGLEYDALVTSEDCEEKKPSAEPIIKACNLLGTKPEEVIMIGDHDYDVEAGKKAGCLTIAVTTGIKTEKELSKLQPDYLIENLEELKSIIGKKSYDEKIFRAYDIRGKYPEEFDSDFAEKLGKIYASYMKAEEVIVGKDVRKSSEELFKKLAQGITEVGANVLDIGTVPSPVLYFTVRTQNKKAGVMITASHNPPEYNGFKLSNGKYALTSEKILELKKEMEKNNYVKANQKGKVIKKDAVEGYKKFMLENIKFEKPLKVVIDSANGTCGAIAPEIFRKKGCQVIELYSEPNGSFPNHAPDPQPFENRKKLIERVIETKADLGIAYDGDGDRVAFVDEQGKPLTGDEAFVVFIRSILEKKKGKIVYEGKTSKAVIDVIKKEGGEPVLTRTGNPSVRQAVLDSNALLGGEIGGHFYFNDKYFGYDDGIYSSLRMAEIISKGKKLSELTQNIPKYYTTPEIRIKCNKEKQEEVLNAVKEKYSKEKMNLLDGVRVEFEKEWFLIRKSNTEKALTLRIEAETREGKEALEKELAELLKKEGLSI